MLASEAMSGLCGHHETGTGEYQTRSSDDVSIAERGKKLCDHVYLFHEPEGQPELEIIFIHGLHKLGDSFENAYFTTWLVKDGHPANCWPMTWLVDKYPTARILSISYDSSLFKTSTSGNMDLHQLGQTLLTEMVTFSGSGIGQKGCPVVFVCHSLGGLIAKKIVVMAGKDFREDKKVSKLLSNIKAFFFYATPHAGSELVSQMARKNSSPLADILKVKCLERAILNDDFEYIRKKVLSKRLEFYTVAETHDTTLKRFVTGMVVPKDSVRYFGSEHIVFVATDHFDVCKPKTKSDSIFLHLIECISKVLDEHKRDRRKILELPAVVVGVDEKLSTLLRKLKDNNIVGLVGMGGIGKTTLSKSMFHSEQGHYTKSCFLENAKSFCKDKSILELQKQLFNELCDGEWKEDEVNRNLDSIQQTIKDYNVLVVIDDPGTEKYLEDLVLAFEESSSGSKVVITSRRLDVLSNFNMSKEQMVEVDGLNDDQALKLISHYAFHGFNDHHEINGGHRIRFEEQAKLIVEACGVPLSEHRQNENHHLPLSLEVVGQHLRKQNRHPADDRMEMWKGALDKLKAARAVGGHTDNEKLWTTLRVSFDDLEDSEKSAFLDFACNLCDTGDIYASSWRTALKADVVQNLIDSSLIKVATVRQRYEFDTRRTLPVLPNWPSWLNPIYSRRDSKYTTLWKEICKTAYSGWRDIHEVLIMHNQLRDMGRRIVADNEVQVLIVHNQFRDMVLRIVADSDKMTRIWKDDDVQEFVEKNKGFETLEGLSLGQSGSSITRAIISQGIQNYHELPKLRLLNFVNTTQGIVEYFLKSCALTPSKLIWLRVTSSWPDTSDESVTVDTVPRGRVMWPCLSAFTRLKVLHISSMWNNEVVPPIEFGGLTSLVELRLSLLETRFFPTKIGTLKGLQILVIEDRFTSGYPWKLPVSIGDLGNLVELHLHR